MPAHIVFGSLERGKETATDRIRVKEGAARVVDAFDKSTNGFAAFTLSGKKGDKVWVHIGQVRVVREAS